MNRTLGILLIVVLCIAGFQTAASQTTVQAGISNDPSGSNILVVRAKPSGPLSGVFASVNVTIRWLTSYNVTLTVVSSGYSIGPQGGTGTDGSYTYQSFGSVPGSSINWTAGSENELFRVRIDGNTGVGTFSLTNSPSGAEWYFEFGGYDIANSSTPFYQQSTSNAALPIQLVSLTAALLQGGNQVKLSWRTLSEVDNFGFEVERALDVAGPFAAIAGSFIAGHGTTAEPQDYNYTDANTEGKSWWYRLKQTDRSGAVNYSEAVQANITGVAEAEPLPTTYGLDQNYPNPFNPETSIRVALPQEARVQLYVYNILGQLVATLADEMLSAGYHTVKFNAASMGSGVYLYRMVAGKQVFMKKMIVLK